jgi:hypothetical protein
METNEGVIIPQEAIQDSTAKKRAKRTLRQLPLYRDMANLKYLLVKLYDTTPRRYTKYLDTVLMTISEAKKCVGLGESSRDQQERADYLSMARVLVEDTHDDITILRQLEVISKHSEKKMKSLAKGIIAQCVAWRDYERSEGAKS